METSELAQLSLEGHRRAAPHPLQDPFELVLDQLLNRRRLVDLPDLSESQSTSGRPAAPFGSWACRRGVGRARRHRAGPRPAGSAGGAAVCQTRASGSDRRQAAGPFAPAGPGTHRPAQEWEVNVNKARRVAEPRNHFRFAFVEAEER